MTVADKIEQVETVLGRRLAEDSLQEVLMFHIVDTDWHEFVRNCDKYAGSVVVDMVNQFINEWAANLEDEEFMKNVMKESIESLLSEMAD